MTSLSKIVQERRPRSVALFNKQRKTQKPTFTKDEVKYQLLRKLFESPEGELLLEEAQAFIDRLSGGSPDGVNGLIGYMCRNNMRDGVVQFMEELLLKAHSSPTDEELRGEEL